MVRDVRDVTPRSRAATRWVFWIMVVVFFAATLTLAVCGADDGDLNPRDTAAIAVGYLALFLFVQIFQWMRRGTTAYPALIAVAMGTVSALVLAGGAYWHCAGSGTPGLTQAVWVGGIFFGSAAMPFGAVPGCPAQPPLSLELAQVMALGVIFFAAARLVLSFIENVAQQFRIRRARNLVLVVGAGDRIAYANTLEYKPETLTVSVGDDVVARQMATPRAGVLHLSGQLSTPDLFQSLLRHRRRGTNLREIHLIDPDTTTNLRRFEAIRDAVGRLPQYRVLQALMRIENPWAAEEWRRNPPDFDGWVVDAFSSYETTAHQLLRQVMAEKHDRLIPDPPSLVGCVSVA